MKSTRDGFGDQLLESGKNKNIIVLSADLSKATKTDKFAKKYPERFFECGIAENNMIGISSGLAASGFKPIITSFASFLTGKYDTIRCSLAYPNEPVIIVGTHVGMAIGKDGVTQMGLEDVAIMRSLPNITIINPATYNEARYWTKWLCENELDGPVYLRLGRQPVKEVFLNYDLDFPTSIVIKTIGEQATVLTTGCILGDVLDATEDLKVDVVSISQLKPFSDRDVKKYLSRFKYVFTVEDHSIIGGLGSIIAEKIAELEISIKLIRIGLNDEFPESAPPDQLYEKYGLSSNKIKETIKKYVD